MPNTLSINSPSKNVLIRLLITCLCFSVFARSDYFINSFYTQLFAYEFLSLIIICITGLFLFSDKKFEINNNLVFIFLFLIFWSAYIVINTLLLKGNLTKVPFLITSLLLCISLCILFLNKQYNRLEVFNILSILALIISIYCFFEFLKWKLKGGSYDVAGLWFNPNITSMFLALIIPIIAYDLFEKGLKNNKTKFFILIVVLSAIIILKSRAAILAVLICLAILSELRFKFLSNFLIKKSKPTQTFFAFALIILSSSLIIIYSIKIKKASSESRVFIWKLTSQLFSKKPLTGYGYGNFEKKFNLHQAEFFRNNPDNIEAIRNASHTKMVYNEFLENAFEGGIIGAAFITFFLFYLVFKSYKYLSENNILYFTNLHVQEILTNRYNRKLITCSSIGVVLLIFMSLVNFTILSTPIMLLMILYGSLIISIVDTSPNKNKLIIVFIKPFSIFLISTGIFLTGLTSGLCFYEFKIRTAINFGVEKKYIEALSNLEPIPEFYKQSGDYFLTIGNVFYYSKEIEKAKYAYQDASQFISTPEVYQQIGNCFSEKGNSSEAIKNYIIANNIQPNRFTPKFLLLKQYIKDRDSINSVNMARELLNMEVKIPSDKIEFYKNIAAEFLKRINK